MFVSIFEAAIRFMIQISFSRYFGFFVIFLKQLVSLFFFVAGQFVKHKLPDLLRSYVDAGKSKEWYFSSDRLLAKIWK